MKKLSFLIWLFLSLAACSMVQENQNTSYKNQNLNSLKRETPSNIFDPEKNKVGDMIAGMQVRSIRIPPQEGSKSQEPISNRNVDVEFQGELILSGKTFLEPDEIGNPHYYYFDLSEDSLKKIPKILNPNIDMFWFSNSLEAWDMLGPGMGEATISISRYHLIQYPHGGWTTDATINSVLEKKY